ncbi:MAG: hypothetical protein ACREVX_12980 [Clostridium sp.]|uniref:hypothetical protein n=1 Tax=Clostridium sp. TaxID=1506 RepID=UPI003D6CAF98
MSENKDTIDTSKKRKIFKILLFPSIIILAIGIFLVSYYTSINKVYDSYKVTLVTNINSINDINKNIAQFNSNQIIDVDYAKQQLPIIIKNLSVLKDRLANSTPTSKYKEDHENLSLGLDKNLLIYRQTLAILNNPSGGDVETSLDNLKTFRNDCVNFYSLIDINDIKISLPETSLVFIDNVLDYSYSAVMTKKETDIKSQQNDAFISEIDGLSTSFLDSRTNFYSYVTKVREKDMSYDDVLSLIDDDFIKLEQIQTNFKSLSVPPTSITTYESFKLLLDNYENYLTDFKVAVTSEKIQALGAVADPSSLDTLYVSSNLLFTKVQTSNDDFNKIYTKLKTTE